MWIFLDGIRGTGLEVTIFEKLEIGMEIEMGIEIGAMVGQQSLTTITAQGAALSLLQEEIKGH